MQRRAQAQHSITSSEDCFDMWRDYMDLSRLMLSLCAGQPEESHGGEPPTKKEPRSRGGSRVPLRACSGKGSAGSSSAGSPSSSRTSADFCSLCKQNGETPKVFRSHRLKSDDGRVSCPILRSFTCPICAATGDSAHTRRYCPQAQRQQTDRKLW